MQKQEFNVAILGFGLSGSTFHAPLIIATKGLKLSHILSSQQARIKDLYPNVVVTQNLDQILADNNINLIINTLPNQVLAQSENVTHFSKWKMSPLLH